MNHLSVNYLLDHPPATDSERYGVFARIARLPKVRVLEMEEQLIREGILNHEEGDEDVSGTMATIRAEIIAGRIGRVAEEHLNGHTPTLLDSGSGDGKVIDILRRAFLQQSNPGIVACDPQYGNDLDHHRLEIPRQGQINRYRGTLQYLVRNILPKRGLRFHAATSIADLHHAVGNPAEAKEYIRNLLESVIPHKRVVILTDTCAEEEDWPRAVANAVACSLDSIKYGHGLHRAEFYMTDEQLTAAVEEAGGEIIDTDVKNPTFAVRERHFTVVIGKE